MIKDVLENYEEYDFYDFVKEYIRDKKILNFADASIYSHLLSLQRREEKYTLSDLAKWHEEGKQGIIECLKRLEECKLIDRQFITDLQAKD